MTRYPKRTMQAFCWALLQLGDVQAAAEKAGVDDPVALLQEPDCTAYLRRARQALDGQVQKSDILRHAAALAVCPANDCVKLAFASEAELGELDLRLLTDLKRSEKGAVEVHLLDRTALLRFLYDACGDGGGLDELLASLNGEEAPC